MSVNTPRAPKNVFVFHLTTPDPAPSQQNDTKATKKTQVGIVGGESLTVTPSGEKRHPVDSDGDGAVLIVEVVDVVCGAEAGGHTRRPALDGQRRQQGQPERQRGAAVTQPARPAAPPPGRGAGLRREPTHARQIRRGPGRATRPSSGL